MFLNVAPTEREVQAGGVYIYNIGHTEDYNTGGRGSTEKERKFGNWHALSGGKRLVLLKTRLRQKYPCLHFKFTILPRGFLEVRCWLQLQVEN